ncbi:MAG: PAS domain S-box protein [Phenylobacterium sp.]|nr:MAG: PAS domain S-box protein [Phenylobacterium sp.]
MARSQRRSVNADVSQPKDKSAPEVEDLPFRMLAQSLPELCWISDAEGYITWVNDAWVAYTGLAAEAIREQGLDGLHDPKVLPEVRRRWAKAKAAGVAVDMVFPLKGRDGAFRPFRTQVFPLRDRDGRINRWFGTNTDVSAQSAAEARLRMSEEELRELFERGGDAIFITDPEGRYTQVNPAACALLGYSRDELLAMSIGDLVGEAALKRALAIDERARAAAVSGDWRLKRKDGSWVDVEISARVLSDGRRLGLVRDISRRVAERAQLERQVGEEAARADAAEHQRQQFWDASRDLLAIIPASTGVPTMINAHAWVATLGYPAEEMLSRRLVDLVHPEDREPAMSLKTALALSGGVYGYENRYRRADGAWVWLSWNVVREGDINFCIARDVTEERARAAYAERAQRLEALGKLTGGVAHDFNNLLTTILGAVDLMQRRPDDRELRDRLMTAALAAVRRGERLTKQLLSFARREPSGGRSSNIRTLLEDMKPLLESALREDIALRYELDPGIEGCAIDAAQFEAAVLNLVVNARDALPGAGVVTVRSRRPDAAEVGRYSLTENGFAVLEVTDTGEGMSAEVLAHVFEPFFTTKDIGKGSGLGLAQVYGAARQAGGMATVDSEPGAGAAVRIYLPTAPLEPDSPHGGRNESRRSERVLLVEDDELAGVVTESMLEDAGYRVTRASDAVEALTALRDGAFEILVTDVRMPGSMNGVQLARSATGRQPGLKVLLCSGWTAESLGRDLPEARWPFLAKPFDQAQLRDALAELGTGSGAEAG